MDTSKLILYEDDTVRINRDQVTVLQYFYPIPMDKTINMRDIQKINLKTDVDRHKQYIQIIVKGLSFNATFSPLQPNKVLQIIRSQSLLYKAKENLGDIKQETKISTQQNIYKQKSHGVMETVTTTLAQGWESVKQGAEKLYEATTEKIHEMTTSQQSQRKAKQAGESFKQANEHLKQGASKTQQGLSKKVQQGKQTAKATYQNTKQKASQGWLSAKQGAQETYDSAAKKVTQTVGQDAIKKSQNAKENFKQGASDTIDSAKLASGYQGSKLQQGKQNFPQGIQSTKKSSENTYYKASDKLGQIGSDTKKKAGEQTKKAGQALKEKGNQIQTS